MTQVGTPPRILNPADEHRLAELCLRNRIRWLAIFGSLARGEARPDSDVDLLVEFLPGTELSYFDLARISDELRPLFGNRKVDIAKPKQLHWYIRDRVLAEARVLYAR